MRRLTKRKSVLPQTYIETNVTAEQDRKTRSLGGHGGAECQRPDLSSSSYTDGDSIRQSRPAQAMAHVVRKAGDSDREMKRLTGIPTHFLPTAQTGVAVLLPRSDVCDSDVSGSPHA